MLTTTLRLVPRSGRCIQRAPQARDAPARIDLVVTIDSLVYVLVKEVFNPKTRRTKTKMKAGFYLNLLMTVPYLLLLLCGSQKVHDPALRDLVEWCDDTYLTFTVCKTKELVII